MNDLFTTPEEGSMKGVMETPINAQKQNPSNANNMITSSSKNMIISKKHEIY